MVLGYLGGWYFSRSPKQPAWDSARKRGRALTLNPKPWNPKTLNPKYINPEDFVPKAGKKSSALPALPGARLVALTVRRPYPHSPPLFPHTHPLHPHTPLPPSSLHTHTPTPPPPLSHHHVSATFPSNVTEIVIDKFEFEPETFLFQKFVTCFWVICVSGCKSSTILKVFTRSVKSLTISSCSFLFSFSFSFFLFSFFLFPFSFPFFLFFFGKKYHLCLSIATNSLWEEQNVKASSPDLSMNVSDMQVSDEDGQMTRNFWRSAANSKIVSVRIWINSVMSKIVFQPLHSDTDMSKNPTNGVETIVRDGRGPNMTLDAHSSVILRNRRDLVTDLCCLTRPCICCMAQAAIQTSHPHSMHIWTMFLTCWSCQYSYAHSQSHEHSVIAYWSER